MYLSMYESKYVYTIQFFKHFEEVINETKDIGLIIKYLR